MVSGHFLTTACRAIAVRWGMTISFFEKTIFWPVTEVLAIAQEK